MAAVVKLSYNSVMEMTSKAGFERVTVDQQRWYKPQREG
jgi:hypothetical protein